MAVELLAERLEIGAVGLHLFRLAELELIEVARDPAVGHMQEQEFRAGQPGKLADVREDGAIGSGVLDGDENAFVHQRFEALTTAPP